MPPLKNGAVGLLLILSSFSLIKDILSEGRIVCYYTNWSVYRPGTAKFNPQNINPYLCTHLIYAFGGFTKDNQMKPFDKYQDVEQGGYAKFTGLKTYNKQLKTLIAIGGWNEASSRFSPLVSNAERRQQFIKNILKFLRQNHFDGIDLDWEYPAHREGGKPVDRENYAQFVQEMRAEFERESQKTGRTRLLITMAVPAGIEYIEKGYDIPKLNKYLDWFNVLTYDFHSSEEPSVNHHAPLFSLEEESEYNYDSELNIDYSIKYYLKAGADRDKLVLGIPTYGRSYTLINEESTDIGAPAEAPGDQGDATREKGYLAYYEICQNIKEDPEWTVVQPNPNVMGPYAFRRNQWVGFDDEAIVRKKAAYAVDHGLGGIMFWAIDNDDFRGTCTGKPYPLIEAAKDEMLSLLGLGINEVSKPGPPKKPVRSRSRDNTSSSINRISGVLEEKPTSLRNSLSRNRKTSTTTTTTISPPTATIKLTEVEKSSLYIGGRTTTPAPPTTPDPGADFKCEEEGFFQHPRDCKKYYWCLDSGPSGLGIVAHQFVCPSGLYFNPAADSCDFARNVPCKTKKSTTTTAATSLSTTTTPAIPRSTESLVAYKNSFYRTSTTPKITTLKTARTTTTTSTANYESDYEYEDTDDEIATINRDVDAEEDPKVLKELIQLIRKVGGIDELEKHLLRKEDGTIAIKQGDVATNNPTTPATISKSLYDKVLSRPNTFNTFRNRLTSSSLFHKKTTNSKQMQGESELEQFTPTEESLSKFSSVLRNARPRPQNDGLDKLPEFDSFIKEKKKYVNISRNRPKIINDSIIEEKQPEDEYSDEVEKQIIPTTQRYISSVRPSYASIRRIKPTIPSATEEGAPARVSQRLDNREPEKPYFTLNRRRGTTTTTTTEKSRYNTVDRVHTSPTATKISTTTENLANVVEEEGTYASDEEQQENVRKQENLNVVAATPKTQIYTTQNYANIGSRFKDTASNSTNHLETSAVKTYAEISSKINENNSFVEIVPNQTITSTTYATFITSTTPIITTNMPTKVSDKSSFSNPDINDNYESENPTSQIIQSSNTTSFNLHSYTVNDEDITTTTSTSSSIITPTTANVYLTTIHTDEFLDEVTTKLDYQVNLRTETTTELLDKSSVPTATTTTEFINITSQSNTNNVESLKTRSRTIQPQQTTSSPTTDSSTDTTFSNQILGTISSPRPFGFPKRRLTPSTLTPITDDSLNTYKFQENANVVKTETAVNSNEPKVSSNANVSSSTVWGEIKREHINTNTQNYKLRTFSQMHFVKSNSTTPPSSNFNENDNRKNNVTKRLYSWRDVRRPSKTGEKLIIDQSFDHIKRNKPSSHKLMHRKLKTNNHEDSQLNPFSGNEMLDEVAPAAVKNSTIQQPLGNEKTRSTTLKINGDNSFKLLEANFSGEIDKVNIPISSIQNPLRRKMENKIKNDMDKILIDTISKGHHKKSTFIQRENKHISTRPTTKVEIPNTENELIEGKNLKDENHINSRKSRQNRGSVKYTHSDLSSLLSLDYTPKPKSQHQTTVRSNSNKRKSIQKNSTHSTKGPLQTAQEPPIRYMFDEKKVNSTPIKEVYKKTMNSEQNIENAVDYSRNEYNTKTVMQKSQINVKQIINIPYQRQLNIKDSPLIFVDPKIDSTEKKIVEQFSEVNKSSNRLPLDHRRSQQSIEASINMKDNLTEVNDESNYSQKNSNIIQSSEYLQSNKTVRVGKTLNSQNSTIFTIDRRHIQLNPRQLNGIPFATTPILKLRFLESKISTKEKEDNHSMSLTNNVKETKDLMHSIPYEKPSKTILSIPLNLKTIKSEDFIKIGSEIEELTTEPIGTTSSVTLESVQEIKENAIELQTENPLSTERTALTPKNIEKTQSLEAFTTEEISTTFLPVISEKTKKEENPKNIDSGENSIKDNKIDAYERFSKQHEYTNLKSQESTNAKTIHGNDNQNATYQPKEDRQPYDKNFPIRNQIPVIRRPIPKQQNIEYQEKSTIKSEIDIRNPIYRRRFVSRRKPDKASLEEDNLEITSGFEKTSISTVQNKIENKYENNENTHEITKPIEKGHSSTMKMEIEPIFKPLYGRLYMHNEKTEALEDVFNQSKGTTETKNKTTSKTEIKHKFKASVAEQNSNADNQEIYTIKSQIEQPSLAKGFTKVSKTKEVITALDQENNSIINQNEGTQYIRNINSKIIELNQKVSKNQTNTLEVPTRQTEIESILKPTLIRPFELREPPTSEYEEFSKFNNRPYGPRKATESETLERDRSDSDSTSPLEKIFPELKKGSSEYPETTSIKIEIKGTQNPIFARPSVSKKIIETENLVNKIGDLKNKDLVETVFSSTISSIQKPHNRGTSANKISPKIENVTKEDIVPKQSNDQRVKNSSRQYYNLNRKNILNNINLRIDLKPIIDTPNEDTEAEPKTNKQTLRRTYMNRPNLRDGNEEMDITKELLDRPPYTLLERLSTTTETTVRATSKTFNNAIEPHLLQQRKNLFSKRISMNGENIEGSKDYYDYDEYVEDEYVYDELIEEHDATDSSNSRVGVGSTPFIVNNTTNNITIVNETQADKFETAKNVIKEKDNVNSKRRLQKYLLSPFRRHEVNVSDKNQVNKNISDDPRAEDDEHSTSIENNSTSIPRRKIVFKYRRPLAQLNSNNINNLNNFNSSVVSETNSNNAATNYSIENQTQINNTASTKRVKKIKRKLINPLNQIHTNHSESNSTPATRNEIFKEKPDMTNVLETTTSATTTTAHFRKKLIARRPFKTASTTKYTRRKFVEYTTTAPTVDDIESDEEYEEEDQKQFLFKLTTAVPKSRSPYILQKINILKNSTSSEATTEANEPDYEGDKPNEDDNNLQISSTPLRNTLTKSVRPPFVPKNRDPTNTNRFGNRKFESPSLIDKSHSVTNRPVPVKATSLRFFERKFISSTTEKPAVLEDLDIEALSARNKKIFDSKKYTSFKNKLQTQPLNNSVAAQEQQQNTENINEIENTTLLPIIHDSTTTTISNETPIVNKTNDNEFSPQADEVVITTPQTPSTTLLHIFTLFDEMTTTTKPVTKVKPRLLSEQSKHKVVEINRIVEVTAKEDKLRRKSRKHPDVLEPIGTSSLKVVSLPHLEQLGEISVVKFVHLVDGSDIEIDGHSTVADYTPTEPNIAKNSAPVRNSLPYQYRNYVPPYATERSHAYEALTQRYGKALIPEVIREAVETSTIPLEGLFDHMRQAKNLNGYDSVTEQPEHFANVETPSSTTTTIKPTTQYSKYVRPIVPLLRPESNESAPIVISLSNLDQVILSKVGSPSVVKTKQNSFNSTV